MAKFLLEFETVNSIKSYTLSNVLKTISKITGKSYNVGDWKDKLSKNSIDFTQGIGTKKNAIYIQYDGVKFIINSLIERGEKIDELKDFAALNKIVLHKTEATTNIEERKLVIPENPSKNAIKTAWTKAFNYDNILSTKNCMTTTMIAKAFGMKSAFELNKILVENKIQYKQRGMYILSSQYSNKGYAKVQTFWINNAARPEMVWTYTGKQFLYDLLLKLGYVAKKNTKKK